MQFFRYSLPVDPTHIQFNFEKTLKRHHIAVTPNALDSLFAKLKAMGSSDGGNFDSPFPLVRSIAAAHNHAKRMKDALGGNAGPKLGKCQQVLSDFYGFGKWDFFKAALLEFSKVQIGAEEQVASKVQKSMSAAGLPQNTAPTPSRYVVAKIIKSGPSVTEKAVETTNKTESERQHATIEEEVDCQWSQGEATRMADAEEANRQWAQEEADRMADQQEADRQWALEEATRMADAEEANRQWAQEEADRMADQQEADRQWAQEEADRMADQQEADRQWAQEEADRMADEEEADLAWTDYQDLGEDDYYIGPSDWVDKLDPEIQQFASQFSSEEEFDEYMERF